MDLITLVLFILGFVFLIAGADLLVRGASHLATVLKISPVVIGLTIVAFGTSAPELAINVQSTLSGESELAVGNIVGSNILNILLILGIAAVIVPVSVSQRLIQLDVPLMIIASFLLLVLSLDGLINHWDGLLLFSAMVFYTLFSIMKCRQTSVQPPTVDCIQEIKIPPRNTRSDIIIQLVFVILGLGILVQGSQWLVDGAVVLAQSLGISELIIGLTIISIGTSLPEIATVVVASIRGQHELIVGNVVGSNLLNILLVLGFSGMIAPAGIEVPRAALVFDMPVMIAVSLACLPIFFTDYLIERWEGVLFLSFYAAYTLYLFLNATQHSLLPAFSVVMLWFVIPLTAITLIVLMWRAILLMGKD